MGLGVAGGVGVVEGEGEEGGLVGGEEGGGGEGVVVVVDGEEGGGGDGDGVTKDGVKSGTVQRHRQGNSKIPNVMKSQNA